MTEQQRTGLERARDAAVARIFEKFPELQSTNVDLLRLLLRRGR